LGANPAQNWALNFFTASAFDFETKSETSLLPSWDGLELMLEEYTKENPTTATMARTTKTSIFFF
jgi:hypothetical protein